ncbi:GrpB family protein [Bacillus sp. AFS017336]|uniref:GrpB family protein n=1 Tax=Bacillus sp. AFS017336 TaxID=2033489 RepID=UPI000BEFFD6C|nr:GrpB family protein [Bacillus sp. AFS017336]PEL14385.1 hypothetical protein CN601_00480 [Bacillus sp. AFS017336]
MDSDHPKINNSRIEIQEYNEQWPKKFSALKQVLNNSLKPLIIEIEHVGSTSVKRLTAKPILDIDVVIADYSNFSEVIKKLEGIGYIHQENWSYKGRDAFGRINCYVPWDGKNTNWMEHHLYVCHKDSEELKKHISFRNYLRCNAGAIIEYEQLKKELVNNTKDRSEYSVGKSNFINKILTKYNESSKSHEK